MSGFTEISAPSLGVLTTVAAGTAAMFFLSPKPIELKVDLDNQSTLVDEEEGVRCSKLCTDGKLIDYVERDGIPTLYENFKRGLSLSDGPCLGKRSDAEGGFDWMTYKEVHDHAHSFGSTLVGEMSQNGNGESFIGICAANCVEWVIAEQACNMYSLVCVPLYDTLGPDACTYIMEQTSMQVMVCDTDAKAKLVIQERRKTPSLRYVIVIQAVSKETKEMGAGKLDVYSFEEVLALGSETLAPVRPPKKDTLATICYTSGTTGTPKGVMLTHGNIMNMMTATKDGMGLDTSLTNEDAHLSFLPLAHMFERSIHALMFSVGGRIGFFGGDVRRLMEDAQLLKPTLFCVVPRLLNRAYDKAMAAVSGSAIKSKLLEWAVSSKMEEVSNGILRRNSIWDYLIFRKIQNTFGGNVRCMVTGSAPVSERVLNFFRVALGCHVHEGYGQTECTAAVACTVPGEFVGAHVGAPIACNYVKLVDVPDMDISVKRDGRGEVCVKGYNCSQGYYKLPEKTRELIDSDGWLHTGDVGLWSERGTLKIVDRCKHMFKLAQGEYVAPEKIEQIYIQCPHVAQVFVDGDSMRTCTVAVVVPDFELLVPTAKEMGISDLAQEALCQNVELRKMILDEMVKFGANNSLKGFEQVKAIYLCPDAFTIENNLLTPTMKSKRPDLRKRYVAEMASMYAELDE